MGVDFVSFCFKSGKGQEGYTDFSPCGNWKQESPIGWRVFSILKQEYKTLFDKIRANERKKKEKVNNGQTQNRLSAQSGTRPPGYNKWFKMADNDGCHVYN